MPRRDISREPYPIGTKAALRRELIVILYAIEKEKLAAFLDDLTGGIPAISERTMRTKSLRQKLLPPFKRIAC